MTYSEWLQSIQGGAGVKPTTFIEDGDVTFTGWEEDLMGRRVRLGEQSGIRRSAPNRCHFPPSDLNRDTECVSCSVGCAHHQTAQVRGKGGADRLPFGAVFVNQHPVAVNAVLPGRKGKPAHCEFGGSLTLRIVFPARLRRRDGRVFLTEVGILARQPKPLTRLVRVLKRQGAIARACQSRVARIKPV